MGAIRRLSVACVIIFHPPTQVPELREALTTFRPTGVGNASPNVAPLFTTSLRNIFDEADRSTDAIPPVMFVQVRFLHPSIRIPYDVLAAFYYGML